MCRIIAIANQKGGVGKTTTCVNLGIGLARAGKKVLLVEADAQGSMAVSLGIQEPDELDVTLVNIMEKVINDEDVEPGEGIIRHEEGIDFIPANIDFLAAQTGHRGPGHPVHPAPPPLHQRLGRSRQGQPAGRPGAVRHL